MAKILKWVSLWPSVVLLMLICAETIIRYPCNHGAGFYCYLYPACGLSLFAFFYGFFLNGSKIGFCISLVCLGLILCSDWFNLYVDYDTWTRRGMPDWGQISSISMQGE